MLNRRTFLRGLIGVAAIPLVGLPAPAPVYSKVVTLGTMDYDKKEIVIHQKCTINDLRVWTMENWHEEKDFYKGVGRSCTGPIYRTPGREI